MRGDKKQAIKQLTKV